MTLYVSDAGLSTGNIRRSVQKHLYAAWSSPLDLSVGWHDAGFDPDALAGGTELAEWGAVSWLQAGAGSKRSELLQVDIVTRVASDPFGTRCVALWDALKKSMRVARIAMYDFSEVVTDEDAEVLIADNAVLVQSPFGRLGAESDMIGPTKEDDAWRIVATYRLRVLSDASRGDYY